MTVQFLFWVIVAAFVGAFALALHIGYHFGRQDRDLNPPPAPVWPEENSDLEDDKFATQLHAWLDEDEGRCPSPCDLRGANRQERNWACLPGCLTDRPDLLAEQRSGVHEPKLELSDTGELRALALAGKSEEIAAQTAAYKKEIDES